MRVASAALIWVWLPLRVRVLLLLAPLLIEAPPLKLTDSVPWLTVSLVVARLPLLSETEIRLLLATENAKIASSLTTCAAGTVFTGATFPSWMVDVARFEMAVPSLTVQLMVRMPLAVLLLLV